MFYFFGKGKCTEVFQVIWDITPEVYCLIGKHLFSSVILKSTTFNYCYARKPVIFLFLTERNALEIRNVNGMEVSSQLLLPAEYYADCVLWKSKLVQIALVGLGIHPQNGQRDKFTHEPPCFHTNNFGDPITVKSSLISDFFQKFASTHHSSFMMPAWRLLQWKMTPKTLVNHKITRFELMCSLTEQATAKY